MLKKGGIELVLKFLNNDDCEIRFLAAWVLASTLQSNVLAQTYALKINALDLLVSIALVCLEFANYQVEVVKKEDNTNAAGKQLYALTSFLSENPLSTHVFVENCHGIDVLTRYLLEVSKEDTIPLKVRQAFFYFFFFLLCLVTLLEIIYYSILLFYSG
jgi:hypothetical protein